MDILYATDGRPPAEAGGALLAKIVDPARVHVTVMHVREYENELVAESYARSVIADAEAMCRSVGIGCRTVVVDGDPAFAIEKQLASGDHDLAVLGAGNHTWLDRTVFGSTSNHVLHAAPSPVILVHREPLPEHERVKVLIGADGSPAAMQAIDTLLAFASPDRVDIHVRTVAPSTAPLLATDIGGPIPTSYAATLSGEAAALASEELQEALDRVAAAGFACRGSVGAGWVATDLLEQAERDRADLVVVGSRGVGVFGRLTMGSVSSHVARQAAATLVAHAAIAGTTGA
jgi:nucleotide-binding universal stress UspA family protein